MPVEFFREACAGRREMLSRLIRLAPRLGRLTSRLESTNGAVTYPRSKRKRSEDPRPRRKRRPQITAAAFSEICDRDRQDGPRFRPPSAATLGEKPPLTRGRCTCTSSKSLSQPSRPEPLASSGRRSSGRPASSGWISSSRRTTGVSCSWLEPRRPSSRA